MAEKYGGGAEDLNREIAALDAIQPEIAEFEGRRRAEQRATTDATTATKKHTEAIKAESAARRERANAAEREAAAVNKLSAAQQRVLGTAATGGRVSVRGGEIHSARALQRMGLLENETGPQGQAFNNAFRPTDVGALVAQNHGLIQSVAIAAASAGVATAIATKNQYDSPIGPARGPARQREAVTREAVRAEEEVARANRELASATRQAAAARLRLAREALAREGAAAGSLGIFATGSGERLRFGIREERTGQRVSGNFSSREAAEKRIASLRQEAGAVERTENVQRRIAVTAGMELAVRQRIVAAMVRYERALNAQPVIDDPRRQIGPGGSLLPIRHDQFGQRDYARGSRWRNGPMDPTGHAYDINYSGREAYEFGPGRYVPRGSHPDYDRWRDYYAGGASGGGGMYRGQGVPRPPDSRPRQLTQFTESSHAEHDAATRTGTDSYISRVAAANAATASMGRYAEAERRSADATRFAAAEFGTADRSMYKHGALTTEFIQAAYRGETSIRDLGNQVALTVGKFAGWTVAASLVYGAARAVTTLGEGALASNSAVNELQRYIGGLDTERAREQLRSLSEEMNLPMDVVGQQFTAAARLTGRIKDPERAQDEAASIARTTLLLSRVGDLDPDTAMRYTSAIQTGFKMSGDQLALFIDQLNQLQNKQNIPFDVSATAVATAAGTWRGAGGSPEMLASLVSAGRRGTGFTGQVLGTTFSRSATMIGRPTNRAQLTAFGIDPDGTVDQIFEQAMRLVETRQVTGRDVIRLGTALSTPQLAGRGVVAALQNPREYREAQRLQDPKLARGSAERELEQMLKSWREQIIQIANGLRQLGGALEQSGLLAPLAMMLKTLNAIADVVQFLVGGFNDLLPPGLRQGVALLIEGAAALALLRRVGAFRAEGRLTQAFPQLAAFDSPERQIRGLAVRGARDQVEIAEAERERAAKNYAGSRVRHEVLTEELGQNQAALRSAERRGVAPGTDEHARLSREITTRERELADAEQERARAMRQTVLNQKVVQRAQGELNDMLAMTPAQAAFMARATGAPIPAALGRPDARGAKLAEALETRLTGVGPSGRPADVLRYMDDVERAMSDLGTQPSGRERLAGTAFGQRARKAGQAMADEIRDMQDNLRRMAFPEYVYQPAGPSGWDGGTEDASTVVGRAVDADRVGGAARERASRAAYRAGQRTADLGRWGREFARNSRFLGAAATIADRTLNAAVTGVDAATAGLRRGGGGMTNLWRSLGALDKALIGFMVFQVAQSVTQPSSEAITRDLEAARKIRGRPRNQAAADRAARASRESISGGDFDRAFIGQVGDLLSPGKWDDMVSGQYQSPISRMQEADRRRNAQGQSERVIAERQRRERAVGVPVSFRYYGDIARDARRLMAEQAAGTLTPGDYRQRSDKLVAEFEAGTAEGRNERERNVSRQRAAEVQAQLRSAGNDTAAVRMAMGRMDAEHLAKAAQESITSLQAWGLSGTRSRQYLMMAREAYRGSVLKLGAGTPEQTAQLAQQREAFFQGIAGTADTDLSIALGRTGTSEAERRAAFGQAASVVGDQTIGYAQRGLSSARSVQGRAEGGVSAARQAVVDAVARGASVKELRVLQARVKSAQVTLAEANVEVGKWEQEAEQMGRLFEQDQQARRDRAYADRREGRGVSQALRQSRTDDPVKDAAAASRTARDNLRDARETYGEGSRQERQAEAEANEARNSEFQARLQRIRSRGELRTAQGGRDTVTRARSNVQTAREALAYARKHRDTNPQAYDEALRNLIEAENAVDDAVRTRAQNIIDLQGQIAVAQAQDDPLVAAAAAKRAADAMQIDPENAEESGLRKRLAQIQAVNQGREARRDLRSARAEYRASVSGDPRDQARAELQSAEEEVREATRGTATWYRAMARRNEARRQLQQADADMATARLELARASTDDPVKQARIDEQIARQGLQGTTGAERIRARARLREAERNTRRTAVQTRVDTVDFNLAMEKITADQAATQLESLAKSHGIGREMRRDLLRRAKELRDQSEQEASGFALDVGTIKLPTIYDVKRAMAPLRGGADLAAAGRMNIQRNVSIGNLNINDVAAADRFAAWFDRTNGSTIAADMRSAGLRG